MDGIDNKIIITNEEGKSFQVEVLDIFSVEGYEDKDYILYTQNIEVGNDNVEAYISILEKDGDNYKLMNITDSDELNAVKEALAEMDEMEYE